MAARRWTAGSAGQQAVIDRSLPQGLTVVAPGGQVTIINVYVDGLREGTSFYLQSRLPEAEGSWWEALAEARAGGDREMEAAALGNLGLVYAQKGELERALERHQAALAIDREIGYRLGEARQLGNLGNVYAGKGELDVALGHYRQALQIFRDIGAKAEVARTERNIAQLKARK